ncbi:MAG: hypothetical protein RLZ12_475 [Bacillota bacterium]
MKTKKLALLCTVSFTLFLPQDTSAAEATFNNASCATSVSCPYNCGKQFELQPLTCAGLPFDPCEFSLQKHLRQHYSRRYDRLIPFSSPNAQAMEYTESHHIQALAKQISAAQSENNEQLVKKLNAQIMETKCTACDKRASKMFAEEKKRQMVYVSKL